MFKKLEGEKFSLRHLSPKNLSTLKESLKAQLEVIRVSKVDDSGKFKSQDLSSLPNADYLLVTHRSNR